MVMVKSLVIVETTTLVFAGTVWTLYDVTV